MTSLLRTKELVNERFVKLCPVTDAQEIRRERFELLLRFFAYSNCYLEFDHAVKDFLDEFLIKNQDTFDEAAYTSEFTAVLTFVENNYPMNNTFILFEDRKAEIEFYYSIMLDIENNTGKIQTIDNSKFFRILKSNFLLMLYNLVEACVVSGMLEIYESLKQSQSGYNELIEEIQSLWSKYKIGEIYKSSGTRSSYEKGVREIIAQVITDEPVFLNRAALEISGNLDARRIKNLCDKHCIRYVASDDDGCLKTVKEKRQNLAHGDESFGDCARDMTLSQLEHIKDEVIRFIGSILNGMKNYYDNKLYLREPEKKKKKASKC